MILGKGLFADRFIEFAQDDQILLYASHEDLHLSSLASINDEQHTLKSLISQAPHRLVIYFSTTDLSVNEADNAYVQAHMQAEKIISEHAKRYIIFRVPQIAGNSKNPKTLLNFLVNAIQTGEKFELWSTATRNIMDVDDIYFIVKKILRNKSIINQTVNLANLNNTTVLDIVSKIEVFLNKKANYISIDKGRNLEIPINEKVKQAIFESGVRFNSDYIEKNLHKYYSHLLGVKRKISIVVPTYFEEHGIEEFYNRTKRVMDSLAPRYDYDMIYVNDGSTDGTLDILVRIASTDPKVKIINFSRNFGNQYAITAGLNRAEADAVVIIDDDLQDPPEQILAMVAKWEDGYDIVYGVRARRKSVSFVFKLAAQIYYRLLDYMSEVKIPVDTGDFRLIDLNALNYLRSMKEENRYLRGMVAWIGFKQFGLLYDRDPRYAGESKFTLKRYFRFAFDGLSSFSEKPLYFSTFLGLMITCISLIFAIYLALLKIFNPEISIRGWTSMATIALFFGGVQLLSTGVIGLYIGKIYREVKGRPLYIVEKEYGFDSSKKI